MKRKGLFLTLVAIILICVTYTLVRQRDAELVPENREVTATSFSWRFVTTESDGELPPRTQVALLVSGDVYNAGTYAGSCSEIADENLLEDEISAVLCWWAGGGDELGVFRKGDRYLLMRGIQEEPTAEGEGFRGDFNEVVVIE